MCEVRGGRRRKGRGRWCDWFYFFVVRSRIVHDLIHLGCTTWPKHVQGSAFTCFLCLDCFLCCLCFLFHIISNIFPSHWIEMHINYFEAHESQDFPSFLKIDGSHGILFSEMKNLINNQSPSDTMKYRSLTKLWWIKLHKSDGDSMECGTISTNYV